MFSKVNMFGRIVMPELMQQTHSSSGRDRNLTEGSDLIQKGLDIDIVYREQI